MPRIRRPTEVLLALMAIALAAGHLVLTLPIAGQMATNGNWTIGHTRASLFAIFPVRVALTIILAALLPYLISAALALAVWRVLPLRVLLALGPFSRRRSVLLIVSITAFLLILTFGHPTWDSHPNGRADPLNQYLLIATIPLMPLILGLIGWLFLWLRRGSGQLTTA